MKNMENENIDKFEESLKQKIIQLQKCQETHNLKSCLKCDGLDDNGMLECPTRKEYIKAVYLSMSKGASGGFEF